MRKLAAPVTALLMACGLAALAWQAVQTEQPAAASPYAGIGGDFALQSGSGTVSLADFRGKVVMLAFGYASCPDVCPITLAAAAAAVRKLPAERADRVAGLFVSVDPQRDSPEQTDAYASYFHPAFVGLTGAPAAVEQVARKYLVSYEKVDMPDSALGYAVDHTAALFLIGPDGLVQDRLPQGANADEILQALQALLG